MYKYFADAGRFTECLTRQNWPVAQEQDNAALESAYAKARRQPGEELLVNVEGRVALRPKMEGAGQQSTLVVERFSGIWPGETCGTRFATEPLENTYWKLTRLGDAAGHGGREATGTAFHSQFGDSARRWLGGLQPAGGQLRVKGRQADLRPDGGHHDGLSGRRRH